MLKSFSPFNVPRFKLSLVPCCAEVPFHRIILLEIAQTGCRNNLNIDAVPYDGLYISCLSLCSHRSWTHGSELKTRSLPPLQKLRVLFLLYIDGSVGPYGSAEEGAGEGRAEAV